MSNPILVINQLSMRFGGIIALKNVSFSVERGAITALIGPNGAGKTTLFNCLTGFYRATGGDLLFYPKETPINIRKILGEPFQLKFLLHPAEFFSCLYYKMLGGSHLAIRSGIARTFQNIRLFREMTVLENLLVAQHMRANRNVWSGLFNTKNFQSWERTAIDIAYDWLEKFHLTKEANRLAGTLPYGMQRHLEIARAMCTQPVLLCLDEPAAGLNPFESNELKNLILSLRKEHNLTIILIEHDMSLVMNTAHHIVVLDHGEIICAGNPSTVQRDQRVIDAYLGVEHGA